MHSRKPSVAIPAAATATVPFFLGTGRRLSLLTPGVVTGANIALEIAPGEDKLPAPLAAAFQPAFDDAVAISLAMGADRVIAFGGNADAIKALDGWGRLISDVATPAILQDSYADSNRDADQQVGNGTITGVAQSFTTAAASVVLGSIQMHLSKALLPTGNIVAKVYAHSGVFGTSSVPGALLATSAEIDAASLTGTPTLTTFTFSDKVVLTGATNYVVTVEEGTGYVGGVSDHVLAGVDTSTPSHGGNLATESGTWTAVAGTDGVFQVDGALETFDVTIVEEVHN